jgi:hypothetical protein
MDRVFLAYGYFDSFRVTGLPGGTRTGFNLNRFDVGAEKTFLNGLGSLYVRVPFLDATDNITGLAIDGLGDISAGLKVSLLTDRETGSTLTAGCTVSTPTSRDLTVTTSIFTLDTTASTSGATLPAGLRTPTTATVNPTFVQPWVAGLLALDRLFVQDYFGVVIPTDDRVSTFLNNDFAVGYQVYRCRDRFISSIAPILDVQALIPLNHQGTPAPATTDLSFPGNGITATALRQMVPSNLTLNSPYQVWVTGGAQIGLADRVLLSAGVVTPVIGPKAYTVGATVGLNFFF